MAFNLFEEIKTERVSRGKVLDKYEIAPFSVLRTTDSEWVKKKQAYQELGIKSEIGRGGSLVHRIPMQKYELDPNKTGDRIILEDQSKNTSIFDPVLAEVQYKWFCPPNGKILDPFCGGSVRGVVASLHEYSYTGIDLRKEQVDSNMEQVKEICSDYLPKYLCGDSNEVLDSLDKEYDFIFSCPPYGDLEVYSDDPKDLSTMSHIDFKLMYKSIINKAVKKLKDDSFAVFVVGDYRDKKGFLIDFVGDTIRAFEEAGARYYNSSILLNTVGSGSMRVETLFNPSRKLVKIHQNVLCFVKGDPRKATNKIKNIT